MCGEVGGKGGLPQLLAKEPVMEAVEGRIIGAILKYPNDSETSKALIRNLAELAGTDNEDLAERVGGSLEVLVEMLTELFADNPHSPETVCLLSVAWVGANVSNLQYV